MRKSVRGFAKRVAIGSAIAALLVGSTVTASPATAAPPKPPKNPQPTCSGSQVGSYGTHGGKITVFVHYSSANGGTNCVWAQKEILRGEAEEMSLTALCPGALCGDGGNFDRDSGNFKYYAGPVTLQPTADECIVVKMFYRDNWSRLGPFHCG